MRTKLVIRRLPPTLPEDVFWQATAQWVTERTCSYKRYVPGRPEADPPVHARAYVVMDPEKIQAFHAAFDGHVFKPKAGPPYAAVVEFAPLQKTIKQKAKVDARQGTIDVDEDYLSFLNALKDPAPIEQQPTITVPTSTPLLDHLRAKKPNVKTAAINAINLAAAKRAPRSAVADAIMVAGKGREVHLGPSASAASIGSSDDNSRTRRKQRREVTGSTSGEVGQPQGQPKQSNHKAQPGSGQGSGQGTSKQNQQPKAQRQPQAPRQQGQRQGPLAGGLAAQLEGHLAQAGQGPAAGRGRGKGRGRGRGSGRGGIGAGDRGGAAGGGASGRIDD